MGTRTSRGSFGGAVSLAALALACASSPPGRGPTEVTPEDPGQRRAVEAPRRAPVVERAPAPATSCPVPSKVASSGYNLAKLAVFSKALFYVRENSPVEIDPRASALVVSALEAVQAHDREIVVERDRDAPLRWVTITVNDQHCALNLERVNAPWSLRSTLQEAMRFVQANLVPASAAEAKTRGLGIEIAATNGMLAGLDGSSALLDAETYRQVRPRASNRSEAGVVQVGTGPSPAPSGAGGVAVEPMSASVRRAAAGVTVGYLRLAVFSPGISEALEQALSRFEAEPVKGLILDLRDNPGGLVNEAAKVADAFVKSGRLGSIVNRRERKDLVAHDGGHEPTGGLVVLVNRRTGSAAELVAAALRNLDRGVVVGEPTAGAASVRVYFDIPRAGPRLLPDDPDSDGDEPLGLLLTTGRLLTTNGGEITGVGVRPDVSPTCPAGEQAGHDEDCWLAFAQAMLVQARDARRATLLSTAKTLSP